MIAKTFEVRDRLTFTVGLAVQLMPITAADRYLLARSGYGLRAGDQAVYIQLSQIKGGGGRSHCDPYDWGDRTWKVAHQYIIDNWDKLESGAVVDVEWILEETKAPKHSESQEAPL